MIQEPFYLILILFAVVLTAGWWHDRFKNAKIIRLLPTPIFCYLPPTILTTAGILPYQSPVYDWITRFVLPASLILLLMTTDIDGLKKVGRLALIAMLGASLTVFIGGVSAFFIYRNQLGPEAPKEIGTLMASWIGGTINELAVKEATGLSDMLFAPLFIADITAVYVWMTLLMILSGRQKKMDQFLHATKTRREMFESEEAPKTAPLAEAQERRISMRSVFLCMAVGFGVGSFSSWVGNQIPELDFAINRGTWVIIVITTFGLVLAFTRFAKKEREPATKIGYFLLYFVLASTGAKAHLLAIVKAPLLLAVGFVWIAIHGILYIIYARIFRIPSGMLATASQANLGGVVSAPIVASTYEPGLVSVGLLLALLGNAAGNYAGILTAQLLQFLSS